MNINPQKIDSSTEKYIKNLKDLEKNRKAGKTSKNNENILSDSLKNSISKKILNLKSNSTAIQNEISLKQTSLSGIENIENTLDRPDYAKQTSEIISNTQYNGNRILEEYNLDLSNQDQIKEQIEIIKNQINNEIASLEKDAYKNEIAKENIASLYNPPNDTEKINKILTQITQSIDKNDIHNIDSDSVINLID